MDSKTLAMKMLEWGELTEKANDLAAEIEAAVLEEGKTQTVGNVRASYSNGRTMYDYLVGCAGIGLSSDDGRMIAYRKVTYDWKAAWDAYRKDTDTVPIAKQTPPSVTVKLI